ncbi:hypothetical protein C8R41DRAFT_982359 [Lentinula lateritia]|uniref:DUF6532 domain-containing protein n=1 Tax=Lentinula lateritia TaxID=40482 RepID=A0ABQ8VAP3_9AGAR|nr:hypothetical protein C8R41DRAFT_982359 [Lentinula lateritia]
MRRTPRHQQIPDKEIEPSTTIETDTDGSDEEPMDLDHIRKFNSDGDEEEEDEEEDDNNDEDEDKDPTPPPPPSKRHKKAAGTSDLSGQRMTRAQTNGKPKQHSDAQLRREYEAMKKREAKLKRRVQAYEETADTELNQDLKSEDETQGNIVWGPVACPLETILTTSTVKKQKTGHSATSTPRLTVLTLLATPASHSTATSRSATLSHSTPTSAMRISSSIPLPGTPQVNDALLQTSTMVSGAAGTDSLVTREKPPPLNFHAHFTASGKPKAEDYDATGKAILLRACHDFEAKIIGLDFFPTSTTWRIIQLINARASRVRGDLVKWTRTEVQTAFGFNADKGKKYNKKIYQTLSVHNFWGFLYKDPGLLTGYAENPLITTFISYIFTARIGQLYESYFNPVSLNLLSGFFAVIRFAIAEWSTGACIQSPPKFTEVDNKPIMAHYLEDLEKWAGMNRTFTDKVRSHIYSKALTKVYKTQENTHALHIIGSVEASMRLELELRTGDTESEEGGMDEDSDHSDNNDPGLIRSSLVGGAPATSPSITSSSMETPAASVPSSRHSSANQSAESLSSARGISTAPSPSRLQPPPPRGSRNRRKSGTSVARKPKDPDSVPRTIVYPASSELQQRPSAGKETNTNQILRVEVNTIRIEQMLHRMIEESRSSLTSASALCQQELPQAMATERTQMEARLMGSLTDDISIPSFGWALTIQKEYIEDVILRCFRRHSIAIVSIVTAALPIE